MKSTFYVRFQPLFRGTRLVEVRAVSVTKGRPNPPQHGGGHVAVRFAMDFDPDMFAIPEVVARIGPGDVEVLADVLPPYAAAESEEAEEAED